MEPAPDTAPHDLHRTVRSVSLGTLWRLLRYPFILAFAFVVPRLMGDATYGRYAYFLSLYVILDVFSDVGVTYILGRFVPELQAQGRPVTPVLHGLLALGLAAALAGALLVGAPLFVLKSGALAPAWWPVLLLLLLTTRFEGTLFACVYGLNQIARFSAKEFVRSAATLGAVVALFAAFGLTGALWGLVVSELVLVALALAWTRDVLIRPAGRLRLADFKPYLLFGAGFYVPQLILALLQRSGNVFIKTLTGADEPVAYFDVANQLLVLTSTFFGLLLASLLPALTALFVREDHATISRWHRTVIVHCGAAVVLTYVALATLGRHAIAGILGPDFLPVYDNALVVQLAALPLLLIQAGINLAMLRKEYRVYIGAMVVGLAVMAAGCVALVPRGQAIGASIATVAGYAAAAAVFALAYRRDFAGVTTGLVRMLLPGVLVVVPLLRLQPGLPASLGLCLAGAAVYVGLLFAARLVRWDDLRRLLDSIRHPAP
jgi:O-antigen/teichoic acid export membrane protein